MPWLPTAKDLNLNTLWSQGYNYTSDTSNGRYGNMSCTLGGAGYCPQLTFDASTNRLTKIGSTSTSTDPAGDLTYDGAYNYQYDAEGRLAKVTSGTWYRTLVYNALGLRVADIGLDGTYIRTLTYPRDIFGDWTGIFDQRPSIGWTGWNKRGVSHLRDSAVCKPGNSLLFKNMYHNTGAEEARAAACYVKKAAE